MIDFVKIETHLHTREVSACSSVGAQQMIELCRRAGYGAVVVTDHFMPGQFKGATRKQFLCGYHEAVMAAGRCGITVLPGMELRLDTGNEDYLLYGIEEEDILALPDTICAFTLTALHALCQTNGWLLYQAHPFRSRMRVMPADCLDGLETRNGNPRHDSHNEQARAYAIRYGLREICGSDAHETGDVGRGGIYVPRHALTPVGFRNFLLYTRLPQFVDRPPD